MSRFVKVGVGALAAVAMSAHLSVAADLDPPAPIIEHKPISVGGGFYLRGDIGYSAFTGIDLDDNVGAPTSPHLNERIGNGLFAGVGVGYDFGKYLRTDITFDIRRNVDVKSDAPCGACIPPNPFTPLHTTVGVYTALANVYLEPFEFKRFKPYISGGVGAAFVDFGNVITTGNPPPQAPIAAFGGSDGFRFAWSVGAGTSYAVNDNLSLDLGYRYLNIADGEVSDVVDKNNPGAGSAGIVTFDDLQAHEVRAGFRYTFGGGKKHFGGNDVFK